MPTAYCPCLGRKKTVSKGERRNCGRRKGGVGKRPKGRCSQVYKLICRPMLKSGVRWVTQATTGLSASDHMLTEVYDLLKIFFRPREKMISNLYQFRPNENESCHDKYAGSRKHGKPTKQLQTKIVTILGRNYGTTNGTTSQGAK